MYTKEDLALVNGMDKLKLRAGCRAAGIKGFSKMNVAGMRVALRAFIEKNLADTTLLAEVFPAPAHAKADVVVKSGKQPAKKPEREVRNGVRKPIKGICADTWTKCSELHAAGKLDAKTLLAWSDEKKLNRSNTSIELSAFRRFHGIARPTKAA